MKRLAIIMVAALGALLAIAPGALAGDVSCATTIEGVTIDGNIVVPDGATCTLIKATVTGNVKVGRGASLVVESLLLEEPKSTIAGNVQADHCGQVFIGGPGQVVGGNVQIQHCTGESGILQLHLGGNFQCHDNTADCFADSDLVGGNVQVNNNVSPGVPSDISDNSILGNLQCQGNSPAPTDSSGANTVEGNKQGQCAGF
jgi:hypothetical protein